MLTPTEQDKISDVMTEIEQVLEKHKAGITYTTNDDGIHVYLNPMMRDSISMGWPNFTEKQP
tara:strand:- start:329 stop:514 length:186 start_codon:yes stop_codon:yes gene_type:complete